MHYVTANSIKIIKKLHLSSAQGSAKVEKQTGPLSGTKRSLNPIRTTDTTVPGRIIFLSVPPFVSCPFTLSPTSSLQDVLGIHPWMWHTVSYLLPSVIHVFLFVPQYSPDVSLWTWTVSPLSFSFAISLSLPFSPTLHLSSPPNYPIHPDNCLPLPFRSDEGQFEAMLRVAVWVFIAFIIQTWRSGD